VFAKQPVSAVHPHGEPGPLKLLVFQRILPSVN
jgi:hypothetical protein